jgi:hypothetical protein
MISRSRRTKGGFDYHRTEVITVIKSIRIGNKHSRNIGRELYAHLNRALFTMVRNVKNSADRRGEANLEVSNPKRRFSTWEHERWIRKTLVRITEIREPSDIEIFLEYSPKSTEFSADYKILIKFNRNSIVWSRRVLEVLKKAAKRFPEIDISEIEFVKSKLGATFANKVHSNLCLPLSIFEGELLAPAELIQEKIKDICSDESIHILNGLFDEMLPEVANDTKIK